ncbi:hypothetical protein scyTo_0007215, partial [Scyliorhinus torazame]|nr:hypothetical protein [Scyliorhinus torazame]
CISLVITVIIGATGNVVGYIFTNDREIIHLVSETIPICAVYHYFEAMTCVCGGVLRGAGKQNLGAIGNIVGFYLIGLPIGISLMFAAKLGVFGLWCGILIAGVVQLIFFLIVIYRINWKEAADEALVNAGVMRDVDTSTGTSAGQTQYLSTVVFVTILGGCQYCTFLFRTYGIGYIQKLLYMLVISDEREILFQKKAL